MDKIISIYWFVILGIIATAIVLMVISFYTSPYDIREIETTILTNKVADCISNQGKLNVLLFEKGGFKDSFKGNFLEICKINFKTEDTWSEDQYYINVEIFNVSNTTHPAFSVEKGNLNFLPNCVIQEDKEYSKLVKCVDKRFYSTGEDNQFLIKILAAVRKTEKNVK